MAAKTELFVRHQAGGMFAVVNEALATGNIFFVHSGTGVDAAGGGRNPDAPLASLDYAVGLCTANNGDRIYLMEGHAEILTGTGDPALDVAGISVIGLGRGAYRPTFTLGTATGATINVSAANVSIENIKVISDLADVAAGITVAATADNLRVAKCELTDGGVTKELVIGISIAAACDGVVIEDNRFFTVAGGGCASAIKLVGATDRTIIRRNLSLGDYSAANIDGNTGAGTLVEISDNVCQNVDTGAGLCLNLHASTTGAVVRNHLQGGKTNTVPIVAAGVLVSENYTAAAPGESGIVRPAVETYA